MRVFYKSMAITMLVVAVLLIAGAILLNQVTQPPEQREVLSRPDDGELLVDADGFLIVHPNPPRETENEIDNENENDNEIIFPMYNAPAWAEDRREYFWTFLIVGLNEGTNANTVMVASYCGVTREAILISIPRDVPVHPTRNGRRLSSSYMIGARNGGKAGGVAAMQRDVQTIIGFIPDFYVLIDYDTFFTIIDAVGGIYIDVPIRMFYTDPFQNLRIDFQPGLQHMNSRQALEFSRFRQGDRGFPDLPGGDLGRVQSQQAVINAVIRELLRPESLLRIPEFISIFNESVYTNISLGDLPFFAGELNHIRRTEGGTDALTSYTFATHGGMVNGVSYQFLTPANVVELLNRTVNPFDQDLSAADLRIIRP